ncbi:esterase-like activity of phytase family protein [Cellulomonas composti]|uniref:Bacterial Ig-like domain-containing protein n=1 Tax=Cellulomonas composti TaxID=266130 RepID=A0A511JDL6_9CELL|nr:esterase-like activity of phytase family protein [Cellulomonas composti]GEL96075.1 hypothetical protein CCO02nite_27330 [Cellulomonas composti]
MLPVRPRPRPRTTAACALVVAGALAATGLTIVPATAATPAPGWSSAGWTDPSPADAFHRLATYPVYLNRPATAAESDVTVAEISAVSEDVRTFVHTDALARRIGFVDITDPAQPVGLGTLDLAADLGVGAHAEPTSVAIVGGYVLVVVDTSETFTAPSGALVVVDLATHEVVRTLELGGQPDSIALTPDTTHAAIAIENQRDENATPVGGKKGDLPQAPGGFLQLVDLAGDDPTSWGLRPVAFTQEGGAALPSFVAAGLDTPQDPEPEYVAIDPTGSTVAVTLQENNGVALVDIATAAVTSVFSAGTQAVTDIDVLKDGKIDQTGSIPATPREPDAIGWLDGTHVATANEGDWKGGTRGWSIFDTTTGTVVWDSGNELERLAVRTGLHNEDRAAKKGVEIEGLAIATMDGTPYAFVGSERSNLVAVYDVSDPAHPAFQQVLATTNGPEGILPVPSRDLLLVSSETDTPAANVRSAVSIYGLGDAFDEAAGTPQFPSVVSADDVAGRPVGWGALGALAPDVRDEDRLWSVTDAAYTNTRLLSLDVSTTPAVIDREVRITQAGAGVSFDVEGLAARPQGGFWLGVEGATGPGNELVRVSAYGGVLERVALPADVSAGLTKWGIEGVTTTNDDAGEHVFVALQRGLTSDPGGLAGAARIGRYDVTTQAWTWFAYPLEQTTVAGDWLGLSEVVAVDDDTLAVIERDKLNGVNAQVKRIYTVDLPSVDPAPGTVAPLTKSLAHDVLPDLRATAGWTQEKLEGLTIGRNGQVYAVTDNDGLADATGETVLLRLGSTAHVFGPAATTTSLTVSGQTTYGSQQTLRAVVAPVSGTADVTGTVTSLDGTTPLATVPVTAGVATTKVVLGHGTHALTASFAPAGEELAGSDGTATVTIVASGTTTTLTLSRGTATYGAAVTAKVSVVGATAAPGGTVQVRDGSKVVGTGTLVVSGRKGTVTVALPRTLTVGTHTLTARYAGTSGVAASTSSSARLVVSRATPEVTLTTSSWTVAKGARPKVTVTVTGATEAPTPTGAVTVWLGTAKVTTTTLVGGRTTVTLPKVTTSSTVKVTYAGSAGYLPATASHTLTVR